MTVSLQEIFAAARAHAAPLAAESAGYLLLAVADSVAVAPREVRAADVELSQDGSVRLCPSRSGSGGEGNPESAVRRLLEQALSVSSSVGPALRRAAAKRDSVGLQQLVRELEAALIPVNRSAARRALARVYRETDRARARGKLVLASDDEQDDPLAAPGAAPLPVMAPIVAASMPVAAPPDEVVAFAADFPEPGTVEPPRATQAVIAAPPTLTLSPPVPAAAPALETLEAELTPEPLIAKGEPAVTKPEPVVERKRARNGHTPQLGTVITAQTLPGEEAELTERAPPVLPDEDEALDIIIDVEEPSAEAPSAEEPGAALTPQALVDPEPSRMPDVVMAMMALHTGVDADEAPTRIRDVVTAPRELALLTPEPEQVDDAWLTQSSLDGVVSVENVPEPEPELLVERLPAVEPLVDAIENFEPVATVEPLAVIEDPGPSVHPFESELTDPVVHNALTWDPGPVISSSMLQFAPALLIAAPEPEPSPYAPAVLPVRQSEVSELLDSFYVSDAPEERELRGALKEMAGLEPTPMAHPLVRNS